MEDLHNFFFFVITGSPVSAEAVKDTVAMTNRQTSENFRGSFPPMVLKHLKINHCLLTSNIGWDLVQYSSSYFPGLNLFPLAGIKNINRGSIILQRWLPWLQLKRRFFSPPELYYVVALLALLIKRNYTVLHGCHANKSLFPPDRLCRLVGSRCEAGNQALWRGRAVKSQGCVLTKTFKRLQQLDIIIIKALSIVHYKIMNVLCVKA